MLYYCPEYILKSLKVEKKAIKLIPIRIISVDNKYFLFSYAVSFNEYFYVNLNKSSIKPTYEYFSSFKKKKELFDYKDYFNHRFDIVTGRIDILNRIDVDPLDDNGYGFDSSSLFIYKTKPFFPEIITALKEKYGDDEIYGYKTPFSKEDVDSHGAEIDSLFLEINVPNIDE